jgi:hypothetical protein
MEDLYSNKTTFDQVQTSMEVCKDELLRQTKQKLGKSFHSIRNSIFETHEQNANVCFWYAN